MSLGRAALLTSAEPEAATVEHRRPSGRVAARRTPLSGVFEPITNEFKILANDGGLSMKYLALMALLLLAACKSNSAPDLDPFEDLIELRHQLSDATAEGRIDEAMELARAGSDLYPSDPVLALLAAQALQRGGERDEAISNLDRAVSIAVDDAVRTLALRNRATLFMETDQPGLAVADLQELCAENPEDQELLTDLGAAAYAGGDFATARKAWRNLPDKDRAAIERVVGPGFLEDPIVALR